MGCRMRERGFLRPVVRCLPLDRLGGCTQTTCEEGLVCIEEGTSILCVPEQTTATDAGTTHSATDDGTTESPGTDATTESPVTDGTTESPVTDMMGLLNLH